MGALSAVGWGAPKKTGIKGASPNTTRVRLKTEAIYNQHNKARTKTNSIFSFTTRDNEKII